MLLNILAALLVAYMFLAALALPAVCAVLWLVLRNERQGRHTSPRGR